MPMDPQVAAMPKLIDHCAVHRVDALCDQQATIVGRCRQRLATTTAVVVYTAIGDRWHTVAIFF